MRMRRKKKGNFLYIRSRAVLIGTGANLLDTECEFYGFKDDVKTLLTNEYHCHKAGFRRNKYSLCCYV